MSTVLLLAQAQYQEPFPFLGEFIKRILALNAQSSAHVFLISRCPLMCHLASRSSLSSNSSHCNCCYSVNSTLTTLHVIICKHLLYEVIHYSLANCLFCSVLVCRCLILYVVCVWGGGVTDHNWFHNVDVMKHFSLSLILWLHRGLWAGLLSR